MYALLRSAGDERVYELAKSRFSFLERSGFVTRE